MGEIVTLAQLARDWDTSLDSLRVFVRRNAHVRSLGRMVGPTRVFTPAEAAALREAYAARRTRQAAAPATT